MTALSSFNKVMLLVAGILMLTFGYFVNAQDVATPQPTTIESPTPITAEQSLKEFEIIVKMVDKDKHPIKGGAVKILDLNTAALISDSEGKVSFKQIYAGHHTIDAHFENIALEKNIDIAETDQSPVSVELVMVAAGLAEPTVQPQNGDTIQRFVFWPVIVCLFSLGVFYAVIKGMEHDIKKLS